MVNIYLKVSKRFIYESSFTLSLHDFREVLVDVIFLIYSINFSL